MSTNQTLLRLMKECKRPSHVGYRYKMLGKYELIHS